MQVLELAGLFFIVNAQCSFHYYSFLFIYLFMHLLSFDFFKLFCKLLIIITFLCVTFDNECHCSHIRGIQFPVLVEAANERVHYSAAYYVTR